MVVVKAANMSLSFFLKVKTVLRDKGETHKRKLGNNTVTSELSNINEENRGFIEEEVQIVQAEK